MKKGDGFNYETFAILVWVSIPVFLLLMKLLGIPNEIYIGK